MDNNAPVAGPIQNTYEPNWPATFPWSIGSPIPPLPPAPALAGMLLRDLWAIIWIRDVWPRMLDSGAVQPDDAAVCRRAYEFADRMIAASFARPAEAGKS